MTETAPVLKDLPLLLPWHAPLVKRMASIWNSGRLPHAILLHGQPGLGKRRFATWFTGVLLCENRGTGLVACGQCRGCRLVAAKSHPDIAVVEPEEGKQQIAVDPIREVAAWLAMTSHQQGWKVAIIDPAQLLTVSAANSLLKTLEEPPPRSLLFLIASSIHGMPATLRSRCQQLAIPRPRTEIALQWLRDVTGQEVSPQVLEFTSGAPLRALEQAQGGFTVLDEEMRSSLCDLLAGRTDVTRVAHYWAKDGLSDRLTWLDLWIMSLARGQLAGSADLVTFPGEPVPLPRPAIPLNISHLYRLVDRTRELKAQLLRTALQRELAVETLLAALLSALPGTQAATTAA